MIKLKANKLGRRLLRNLPDSLMEDRLNRMGRPDVLEDMPSEEEYEEDYDNSRIQRRKRDRENKLFDDLNTRDVLTDMPSVKSPSIESIIILKTPISFIFSQNDVKLEIIKFFKENPNPDDSKIHELADTLAISPHDLETYIYELLTEKLND